MGGGVVGWSGLTEAFAGQAVRSETQGLAYLNAFLVLDCKTLEPADEENENMIVLED